MSADSRFDSDESRKEYKNVAREVAGRIAARGVHLRGDETPSEIAAIEEALERFELAVERHGGDLMVDEAPRGHRTDPDSPRFRLPERTSTMSVGDYLGRLALAIDGMRKKR